MPPMCSSQVGTGKAGRDKILDHWAASRCDWLCPCCSGYPREGTAAPGQLPATGGWGGKSVEISGMAHDGALPPIVLNAYKSDDAAQSLHFTCSSR